MARARKALPAQIDVAHLISAGVLASVCPRTLIEEVLAQTGKASQRERLLPAPAVVYYVMALALWREAPLEEGKRSANPSFVSAMKLRTLRLGNQRDGRGEPGSTADGALRRHRCASS